MSKADGIGTAVTLDHDTAQPKQTGAVIAYRVQFAAQTTQRRARQKSYQPASPVRLEGLLHTLNEHSCQPFACLEHSIANETVAHYHIYMARVDTVTFDKPTVIHVGKIA